MRYFAANAVWVPYGPVRGQDEIRKTVDDYLSHLSQVEFEIVNLAVAGNVVLTERADHLIMDGNPMETRLMAVIEVTDGNITAWRDYFEPQFHG